MAGKQTEGPDPVDVHVGHRIKLLRKINSVSQQALAEGLGVTFQQVQKYERGANRVSASTLYRISQFFKVGFGYFVEGLQEPEGENVKPDEFVQRFMADTDGLVIAQSFLKLRADARRRVADLVETLAE